MRTPPIDPPAFGTLSLWDITVPPAAPAGRFDAGTAGSELAGAYRWTPLERAIVDAAIVECARTLGRFTADDVWRIVGDRAPVTKGLAGRLNAACRAGLIRPTGLVAISQRTGVHGHGQRLGIWQATA